MLFRFLLSRLTYAIAEELDKILWAGLNEKDFPFAVKRFGHLESREILCLQRPGSLVVLTCRGYNFRGNGSGVCTIK